MAKSKDDTIAELKEALAQYDVNPSISKFLLSLKRQMDNFTDIMNRVKPDETSLISNSDKTWDRIFTLIEKAPKLMQTMTEVEKLVQNQRKDGEQSKKGSGSIMEDVLRDG